MERLAAEFGDRVSLTVFGCEDGDIPGAGLSPAISNRGVLSRSAVAQVLRGSDMFLDLSDYQAFGRTGLEAMACGCVPVLPLFGGAGEYARHRRNAFLVDTRSDEAIMAAIVEFMGDGDATRARMRKEALTTALGYSVERAVQSEHQLFEKVTRAG
jgi:glycosyltransferase involved in cell wall biosynthesis